MAKRQSERDEKKGSPEYMTTYGDMMTLILCFFVMLFAMSSVDAKKFEAIVRSFSGSLGVLDGGNTITQQRIIDEGSISNLTSKELLETESFESMERKIKEYLEENELQEKVEVVNEEQGLLLRFQDSVLFDQGSATIKQESLVLMDYIAKMLQSPNFKEKFISVEGHTDNVPINSTVFPSNWELSVTRASNVVRYLIERGGIDPTRLSASGYSEYHPIVDNISGENMAKNRRVDVLIMRSKNVKSENSVK